MKTNVQVENYLQMLQESWAWQPSTVFVHQLVKSNSVVDERLAYLVEKGVVKNTKSVYMFSFMHPDYEYCMSFICSELPRGASEGVAWFANVDPMKLNINKRMVMSGVSFEV